MRRISLLILLGLLASACARTPNSESSGLTIYTGRDKDEVAQVIDLFTKKYAKYNGAINTITLGEQAANEGLLAPSKPASASLIDPSRKDEQGRWYAEMLLPEVIIYNHDLLKPDQ